MSNDWAGVKFFARMDKCGVPFFTGVADGPDGIPHRILFHLGIFLRWGKDSEQEYPIELNSKQIVRVIRDEVARQIKEKK